jgi:hypothetical protein
MPAGVCSGFGSETERDDAEEEGEEEEGASVVSGHGSANEQVGPPVVCCIACGSPSPAPPAPWPAPPAAPDADEGGPGLEAQGSVVAGMATRWDHALAAVRSGSHRFRVSPG